MASGADLGVRVPCHTLVCQRPSQCARSSPPEQEPEPSLASASRTVPWLMGGSGGSGSPARAYGWEPGRHTRAAMTHARTHLAPMPPPATGAWRGIPGLPCWALLTGCPGSRSPDAAADVFWERTHGRTTVGGGARTGDRQHPPSWQVETCHVSEGVSLHYRLRIWRSGYCESKVVFCFQPSVNVRQTGGSGVRFHSSASMVKSRQKAEYPSPHHGTPSSPKEPGQGGHNVLPHPSLCRPGPLGTRVFQHPARAGHVESRHYVHPITSGGWGVGGAQGEKWAWGLFLIHLQPEEHWGVFYNERQELPSPLLAHISPGANTSPQRCVGRPEGFLEAEKQPAPRPSLQRKHRRSAGPRKACSLCGPWS